MPYFWPLLTPTPSTPTSPTTPFVALQGAPRKAEEIKQLVPPWMETRYPSLLGALLHALGVEDHRVTVGDRTLFIRGLNPAGNVLYVAKLDDAAIRVRHLYPTTSPSTLSVAVTGKDVLVTLGTDISGNITTTAASLRTALAASTATNDLVGLTTFGSENEPVGSTKEFIPLDPDGLEGARRDTFLAYARGDNLSVIGNNYGIAKPLLLSLSDDQFRKYIAALALRKKVSRESIEGILTALFGDKSTAGWAVYELRRRTITIEVTNTLLATGPGTGTFLRPTTTVSPPSSVPEQSTTVWTGDYLRASAVSSFVPRVRPVSGGPVSNIPNNSVYPRARGATRPALLNVLKLVRAAGVQVEFRQRRD